ncbi:MAG: hypothetical protein ACXVA9_08270 [Bdellovibrionales bacterium]
MNQFILSLLICLTLLLSQFASAESYGGGGGGAGTSGKFYIEETFFPVYVKKNEAQTSSGNLPNQNIGTESGIGYDLRTTLGYVAWENVLFGLSYNMYSLSTSRPTTSDFDGYTSTTKKTEFGPTVGYLANSWRFMLTYFAFAEKTFKEQYTTAGTSTVNTDNTYKNTSGSGFQLAVSYGLNIGSGFTIGPTLIYRDVTYKKQSLDTPTGTSYASTTPVTPPVDGELKPMITVVYRF